MELKFLGCGSAFNPTLGSTSAYFTEGGRLFVMDAGESIFIRLYKLGLLERFDQIIAVITHTHADHVGSLPSLISYCYYVLHKKITVVHPNDSLAELLDKMGIDREAYYYVSGKKTTLGQVTFEAVPVEHVDDLQCFGYILTEGEQKIYYSGDASDIPDMVMKLLLCEELHRIYQDTTEFMTEGHRSHCPLEILEEKIPGKLRDRVYCMHFTTEFNDKLTETGFKRVSVSPDFC